MITIGPRGILVKVKAVSWMWVLPTSCLVTLLAVTIFSLFRRRPLTEVV